MNPSTAFRGEPVLVTGGLGFIGSNLARRLLELGARVTIVDSLIPEHGGNPHNIAPFANRVRVRKADIRDASILPDLLREQNYVFNLAGQTSHWDSMTDPVMDLELNCRAHLSLLEACRKHNPGAKIIFASTRQIYGRHEYLPVDERHPLRPVDVNGINKLAGESYHLLYGNVYGMKTSVLRLTNTYGPHMRVKDARQTFLGVWIRRLIEGEPFEVWGGEQLRDFNYVDDTIDAFIMAAVSDKADGVAFNVGGHEVVDLTTVAELMIELNGGGRYVVRAFPDDRKRIDIGDFYADYQYIQSTLGWSPRVSLREGLARTLRFYREHISHYL